MQSGVFRELPRPPPPSMYKYRAFAPPPPKVPCASAEANVCLVGLHDSPYKFAITMHWHVCKHAMHMAVLCGMQDSVALKTALHIWRIPSLCWAWGQGCMQARDWTGLAAENPNCHMGLRMWLHLGPRPAFFFVRWCLLYCGTGCSARTNRTDVQPSRVPLPVGFGAHCAVMGGQW